MGSAIAQKTNQFAALTFRNRDSISIGHSYVLADVCGDSRNKDAHLLQSELPEQPINLIPKPTYRAHILRELILAKQFFVALDGVTFDASTLGARTFGASTLDVTHRQRFQQRPRRKNSM